MTTVSQETFPGGSKARVNRAGDRVRTDTHTPDDLRVIDEWRAAHRSVLNTFQAILRNRTKGKHISVAQRHKRRRTIFEKLGRYPDMQLARMDDVAGCRLIFDTIRDLRDFREAFHEARFGHKRRNEVHKYDYIARPKPTGYRGVHDVYEYNVNSKVGRALAGLYVEIQYRTLVQHAWATAVELIGFITESQPKFQRGDDRYGMAMALASEVLARAHEGLTGPFPTISDGEVVTQFRNLDKDLGLLQMFGGLNAVKLSIWAKRNAILVFSPNGELVTHEFRNAKDALIRLFELEKSMPECDIVLVRADTSEDVRLAFRNYFSDASDFVRLLENGCRRLSP
jgi:ppGpp synthetase/RelA/SpoT-type nucleotidyltranferase